MQKFVSTLVLVVSCTAFADSVTQQQTPSVDTSAKLVPPSTFAQVVRQYFSQWDLNGDGKLSKEEIEAAVANPKVHDEAAAAIAIIRMVVHGGKYSLPPITQDYLVLPEPSISDDQIDSLDDPSKAEKINQPPAFQARYLRALQRLRQTPRELFPQSLPSIDAIHQEGMGDCEFLSTVGAMVHRDRSAVKAMFTQNNNGSITVVFGNAHPVNVAHVTDADIVLCTTARTNGLWLTALEKAYRKYLLQIKYPDRQDRPDIYDKMANSQVVEILDGHPIRKVPLRPIRSGGPQLVALRNDLVTALRDHRLVKAGTPAGKKTPGITPVHAYAILGYNKETDLVHIWNPHGNDFTPKGPEVGSPGTELEFAL